MTSLFWWVVAGTIASFIGILTAMWYANMLYLRGQRDADNRANVLLEAISEVTKAAGGGSEEDELSPEESVKKNKEFWIAVSDIMIARMREIDAKTAGGVMSGKQTEARGLMDLLTRSKKDPEGVFKELLPDQQW